MHTAPSFAILCADLACSGEGELRLEGLQVQDRLPSDLFVLWISIFQGFVIIQDLMHMKQSEH